MKGNVAKLDFFSFLVYLLLKTCIPMLNYLFPISHTIVYYMRILYFINTMFAFAFVNYLYYLVFNL